MQRQKKIFKVIINTATKAMPTITATIIIEGVTVEVIMPRVVEVESVEYKNNYSW